MDITTISTPLLSAPIDVVIEHIEGISGATASSMVTVDLRRVRYAYQAIDEQGHTRHGWTTLDLGEDRLTIQMPYRDFLDHWIGIVRVYPTG